MDISVIIYMVILIVTCIVASIFVIRLVKRLKTGYKLIPAGEKINSLIPWFVVTNVVITIINVINLKKYNDFNMLTVFLGCIIIALSFSLGVIINSLVFINDDGLIIQNIKITNEQFINTTAKISGNFATLSIENQSTLYLTRRKYEHIREKIGGKFTVVTFNNRAIKKDASGKPIKVDLVSAMRKAEKKKQERGKKDAT